MRTNEQNVSFFLRLTLENSANQVGGYGLVNLLGTRQIQSVHHLHELLLGTRQAGVQALLFVHRAVRQALVVVRGIHQTCSR